MEQDRIVFTRFTGDGKEMFNDIYMIDPDGKNEVRLTMNPGPRGEYGDNAAPRYNKDRSMLAFVSTKNHEKGLYNIFFMDLKTRKTAQITTGDLNIRSVDWAPDDSRLVFAANDDKGTVQVHTIALDGTGFTQLTQGPAEHMNPLWSPRGDLIAYVEFLPDTEESHIWVMDPSGGNNRKLTTLEAAHTNPSWSPDGTWLVFRCDAGKSHLRKQNVDSGEVFLFQPPAQGVDSSPIWSSNGIVFSSNCDWEAAESIANLYLMNEQGQLQKRLTKIEAFDYCGDW